MFLECSCGNSLFCSKQSFLSLQHLQTQFLILSIRYRLAFTFAFKNMLLASSGTQKTLKPHFPTPGWKDTSGFITLSQGAGVLEMHSGLTMLGRRSCPERPPWPLRPHGALCGAEKSVLTVLWGVTGSSMTAG